MPLLSRNLQTLIHTRCLHSALPGVTSVHPSLTSTLNHYPTLATTRKVLAASLLGPLGPAELERLRCAVATVSPLTFVNTEGVASLVSTMEDEVLLLRQDTAEHISEENKRTLLDLGAVTWKDHYNAPYKER